jgi:hypothetical protein
MHKAFDTILCIHIPGYIFHFDGCIRTCSLEMTAGTPPDSRSLGSGKTVDSSRLPADFPAATCPRLELPPEITSTGNLREGPSRLMLRR